MKNWSHWQAESHPTFPPVIALGGEERALVEEAVQAIRRRVLVEGTADFNHDKLDAKDYSLAQVLAKADTLPMFSALRLVEVSQAEIYGSEEVSLLEKYLEKPSPSTVLLLNFRQMDQRQAFVKLLDKKAVFYRFESMTNGEKQRFVAEKAKAMGLVIEPEATLLLIEMTADDILLLYRSLEKLQIATQGRVTVHDISKHISDTHVEDAFLLGRAILLADRKSAAEIIFRLENDREPPIRLVGLLAWQLRQVLKARLQIEAGRSPAEIGKALGLFGERQKLVLQAAQRGSMQTIGSKVSRLAELDKALKSSRASAWQWLTRVIFQFCPIQSAHTKQK